MGAGGAAGQGGVTVRVPSDGRRVASGAYNRGGSCRPSAAPAAVRDAGHGWLCQNAKGALSLTSFSTKKVRI